MNLSFETIHVYLYVSTMFEILIMDLKGLKMILFEEFCGSAFQVNWLASFSTMEPSDGECVLIYGDRSFCILKKATAE